MSRKNLEELKTIPKNLVWYNNFINNDSGFRRRLKFGITLRKELTVRRFLNKKGGLYCKKVLKILMDNNFYMLESSLLE